MPTNGPALKWKKSKRRSSDKEILLQTIEIGNKTKQNKKTPGAELFTLERQTTDTITWQLNLQSTEKSETKSVNQKINQSGIPKDNKR